VARRQVWIKATPFGNSLKIHLATYLCYAWICASDRQTALLYYQGCANELELKARKAGLFENNPNAGAKREKLLWRNFIESKIEQDLCYENFLAY
jgi:hypothetical protein